MCTPAQSIVPENRMVRFIGRETTYRFTQRGTDPNRGFVRIAGRIVSGSLFQGLRSANDVAFDPDGANANFAYENAA